MGCAVTLLVVLLLLAMIASVTLFHRVDAAEVVGWEAIALEGDTVVLVDRQTNTLYTCTIEYQTRLPRL